MPKGFNELKPFDPEPFQMDMVEAVFDRPKRPRTAGFMLPRGSGKSTLLAAIGVWELFTGGEAATVALVASSKEQSGIIYRAARRMVELSPELLFRCQIGKERLYIPVRDAVLECLPAEGAALLGLDYTLALLDEVGVVSRETYECLSGAQLKRPVSTLIAIGTPGPDPNDSVLTDLRDMHAELGDEFVVWREWSANEFQHHPVDCQHCWKLANPALGIFQAEDAMVKALKTRRENVFRRDHLCQLVNDTTGMFLPAGVWEKLSTGRAIPKGTQVVIGLDGSHSDDSTALVIGTVSAKPHFDLLAVWEKPAGDDNFQVPIAEVEDAIRQACRDYRVVELACDPWGFTRTMQILESEGLTVSRFDQNSTRLTPATTDLYTACVNGTLTHSGNETLTRHVGNAVVYQDHRGIRINKANRRGRKIDAAAALVMCHSRATWHGTRKPKQYKVITCR
ncbi:MULTISPECIES: terminase TerL endonuclease subunit [unclassified Mycolicibacterium]|uniref:terminase TerL endonuclease subunit n=1 Tax=unclassified Mycolicibacterium TaxID=2636767 RepID=UPI0028149CF2|nr:MULTISPECIES: terminase TerL endonuclease subunit [unclassified Mycolicibacterium]